MPRYSSKKNSSSSEKSNYYDLTTSFTSATQELVYDKQDGLVFWADFCTTLKPTIAGIDRSNSSFLLRSKTPGHYFSRTSEEELCKVCGLVIRNYNPKIVGGSGGTTVYDTNEGFYVDDHDSLSHTDGSSDKPFSISFWLNSSSPYANGNAYLVSKTREYTLLVDSDNRITLKLFSSGFLSYASKSAGQNLLTADAWHNIVVTYDGRGGGSAEAGINIYLNGVLLTSEVTQNVSYTNMSNTSNDLTFSYAYAVVNSALMPSKIADPAMWNVELTPTDVAAINDATRNCMIRFADGYDSGYINLSPRILLRRLDNATGSYPVKLRLGDKDRPGSYTNFFKDTFVQTFGKGIKTNFPMRKRDISKRIAESTHDIEYSDGMLIRREYALNKLGERSDNSALVFSGLGKTDSSLSTGNNLRYLVTKNTLRNVEVRFDLIQGPYNKSAPDIHGLDLGEGLQDGSDDLYIQIAKSGLFSSSFSSWTTIKRITPEKSDVINKKILSSKKSGILISNAIRTSYKLTMKDFNTSESFYLRIAQIAKINDKRKQIWAIDNLHITSANQNIRYPLLLNHDTVHGAKADNDFIATPHTRSDITALGRTMSGISDTMLRFTPGEGISPFNENHVIEEKQNIFFSEGVSSDIYPGFSQKLSDKTRIIADLTPNTPSTFGYESKVVAGGIGTNPQQHLMVYWNSNTKNWDKVGKGFQANGTGGITEADMMHAVTSSAVGFGSLGFVASGSNVAVVSKNELQSFCRPTSTFGFPFDGRYHANNNQAVIASDLGINKPFFLEKAVIRFDANFEFANYSGGLGGAGEQAFCLKYFLESLDGNFTRDSGFRYYLPTFFMLRQFEDRYSLVNEAKFEVTGNIFNFPHTSSIPQKYDLDGNGSLDTIVYDSRELISYGQLGILLSGSGEKPIDVNYLLDNGLKRESLEIVDMTSPPVNSLSGSFEIPFNIKQTQAYRNMPSTAIWNKTTSPYLTASLFIDNKVEESTLRSVSRRIKNENISFENSKTKVNLITIGGSNLDSLTNDIQPSLDKVSPYIILPKDKLVFGFQYPLSDDTALNNANVLNVFLDKMTLSGNVTLFLYGSQIKNNKEAHDTLNQHLTSDNVHEVIGDDLVVDQFQITRRNEETGSFYDTVAMTNNIYETWLSSGEDGIGDNVTKEPVKRIDINMGSMIDPTSGLRRRSLVLPAGIGYANIGKPNKFVNIFDSKREFRYIKGSDHPTFKNSSLWLGGEYGTFVDGRKPKYYFNNKNYGFVSNMLEQGRDSAFTRVIEDKENAKEFNKGAISPSVKIIFVSSSLDGNGQNIYHQTQSIPSSYQSFNSSRYATASIPFFDTGH